jgi:RNA 2',3'-cyclic 3'-phosphodiesterase
MRLFIAADIDDATRAQLALARDAIQKVLAEARVPPRLTWVKDDNAHVTLRFIGEAPEQTASTIQETLAASLHIEPFDVRWEKLGTFGGSRNPRVIWIAPTSGLEPFTKLAEQVNAQLAPVIGPGESRPFKPHLTLARVKEPGKGVDWERALAAFRFTPTIVRIDHVTLYQSRLSPKGPTYTALSTHG